MTRVRRAGVLLGLTLAIAIGPLVFDAGVAARAAVVPGPQRALLVVVRPTSFRAFMKVPTMRQLARAGGAGLMATNQVYRSDPAAVNGALLAGAGPPSEGPSVPSLLLSLRAAGIPVCRDRVSCLLRTSGLVALTDPRITTSAAGSLVEHAMSVPPGGDTLVIVVALQPTPAMDRVGDEVTPIVKAEGDATRLFPANGPMHALTSDTTRFPGLVANVDIAPTILSFFHVAVPQSMSGSPIRVSRAGAPFTLDRRQIQQRAIRVPVQVAEGVFVSGAGLAVILALVALDRRGGLSARASLAWRALILFMVALPVPLAMGGLLPSFTYVSVTAWIVLWAGVLTALALAIRRPDPMFALTFLGVAGLAALSVDLLFGGHGLRVPLLGGTMFEGVRMYGLPNAFISTLLASGLFVAVRLDTGRGTALLVACGLVAGLPQLGADVGGSITLFAAAGLWWQLRSRGRLGLRELVLAFLVTVAGLVVVLLISRFLALSPTHATRFVEQSSSAPSSGLAEIRHRLWVGVHQVASYPVSAIPLVGLPVMLWVAVRRPGVIGRALAAAPGWRDVAIVVALAAFVAYVVDDTGMAAAAPSFLYGMAALAYPAFAVAGRPSPAESPELEREASPA